MTFSAAIAKRGPVAPELRPPRIHPATGWTLAIVTACLLAWIICLVVMAEMDEGPGTPLHDLPTFLIGWIVMLTAMMLPSEISYIRVFAAQVGRSPAARGDRALVVACFIAGYAVAWTGYGLLAFILDAAVRESAADLISWYGAGPVLAGATLVLAGLYQVSALKQSCLSHCRSPHSFLARHWRSGHLGALRMGSLHGLVCVGCCWALMAVMFAVGAMSLIWMGILALIMFAEKVLPFGRRLTLPITAFLWIMGAWIALSPDTAPLLKDPLLFGSAICRAF